MDVKAYIYVETHNDMLCFKCAVNEIIAGDTREFDLALEQGSIENGNDMRSIPQCTKCGKMFHDFCIA